MNFPEIPVKRGRYNLKRRFALHVKCAQLFLTRNKITDFLENVCGMSDIFFWKIPPIETEIQPRKYNFLQVKCP